MPGILGLYDTATNVNNLDETTRSEVFNEVIDQINHEFSTAVLQGPSDTDRQRIRERVEAQISAALRKRNCRPGAQQEGAIAEENATMAELPEDLKNRISHRARALQVALPILQSISGD